MASAPRNPAAWRAGRVPELSCVAADKPEDISWPVKIQPEANQAIGIDPGNHGGLAVINAGGKITAVFDMPLLADGPKGRKTVNAALLADLIYRSHAEVAYCELVGTRPGEGAVGAFNFGRSRGVIEGVLAAAGVPIVMIAPAVWKRAIGLPTGAERAKDAARAEAIRRWPSMAAAFARVKDHGRAEACLIAAAGLIRRASL